jgi:hypothetical protein
MNREVAISGLQATSLGPVRRKVDCPAVETSEGGAIAGERICFLGRMNALQVLFVHLKSPRHRRNKAADSGTFLISPRK